MQPPLWIREGLAEVKGCNVPVEKMHVTLTFNGTLNVGSDHSQRKLDDTLAVVLQLAQEHIPCEGMVVGFEWFGHDHTTVAATVLANEGLFRLQRALVYNLKQCDVYVSDGFAFTPHITVVKKAKENMTSPNTPIIAHSFQFEAITVVPGDLSQATHFPLIGVTT
jgi:2'-5' RNA ligase